MTEHVAAREAREALDDLHLIAHHAGPTDDASAGHRRGADLWDATRAPGSGDTVRPWADLDAVVQAHTTAVITRALADVLEVEQVMYRALEKVLALHQPDIPVQIHRGLGTTPWCRECDTTYPCLDVRIITTALAGVEGEG
ncbi:hypothetical protein M3E78_005075 [Micrococcus luteus]|nr:hypothetical protein [Micrococcus luteus]MCV7573639.1 hypothetical protein [Micrococcus luteus]